MVKLAFVGCRAVAASGSQVLQVTITRARLRGNAGSRRSRLWPGCNGREFRLEVEAAGYVACGTMSFAAALRLFGMGLLIVGSTTAIRADGATARPGRPTATTALATKRFGNVDYVSLSDAAKALGLKASWAEAGRRAVLTDAQARAELTANSRETMVNGLRVFLGDPVLNAGGQLYISEIDFARCLTPLLQPGRAVARRRPQTIVLDPGHGGKDHGTSSYEKVYALDVAKRMKPLLEAAGFKVVLTREEDVFVGRKERAILANAHRADVFVSIHFNALPRDTKTSGVEVFSFAPRTQRSTDAWSAGQKTDAEAAASPVNRWDGASTVLAQAVQRRLVTDLKAFDRGKKLAHWAVLRGLNCPGVLVECGFLTSEVEAKKIATAEYRGQIAATLAAGLSDYARVCERGF